MGRRRSPPQQRAERALDREFFLKRYDNERRRNPLAAPGTLPLVIVLDRLKAGFNLESSVDRFERSAGSLFTNGNALQFHSSG